MTGKGSEEGEVVQLPKHLSDAVHFAKTHVYTLIDGTEDIKAKVPYKADEECYYDAIGKAGIHIAYSFHPKRDPRFMVYIWCTTDYPPYGKTLEERISYWNKETRRLLQDFRTWSGHQ